MRHSQMTISDTGFSDNAFTIHGSRTPCFNKFHDPLRWRAAGFLLRVRRLENPEKGHVTDVPAFGEAGQDMVLPVRK